MWHTEITKINCSSAFLIHFKVFKGVTVRDGFRERGALGHLSFGGPTQVRPTWPFV